MHATPDDNLVVMFKLVFESLKEASDATAKTDCDFYNEIFYGDDAGTDGGEDPSAISRYINGQRPFLLSQNKRGRGKSTAIGSVDSYRIANALRMATEYIDDTIEMLQYIFEINSEDNGGILKKVFVEQEKKCCDSEDYAGFFYKAFNYIRSNSKGGKILKLRLSLPQKENDIVTTITNISSNTTFTYTNLITFIEIYSEVSSEVSGIIDLYGPTDISKMNDEPSSQNHIEPDSPEGFLIGRKNVLENPDLVKPTIVMNYISKERKIPPVLIFHGTNDELVPFGQSCMLYDKLKECGKEAYFYAMNGSNHGGREFWSDEIFEIIRNFIDGI